MKNSPAWILAIASSLLLVACFETEQEFTLNPDGTGKVAIDSLFPNLSLSGDSDQSEAALKKVVGDFIKQSEGVDAWKDVTYKWSDDGRVHFRGTAYFADISQLKFENLTMMSFDWAVDGGNGVLKTEFEQAEDSANEERQVTADPDERKKEINIERQKFQQTKPMLAGFLTGMKHRAVFNLPGKTASVSNFTERKDGRVEIEITGEKMLTAMEKMVNDDEWMMENSFDPQEGPSDLGAVSEMLFGKKGPVEVKSSGLGKPLFDYEAELAVARKDFGKLQEEFTGAIAPPAAGEPMKSLKVVGVQHTGVVPEKFNLRPFNAEPGLLLSVFGEFPGSVLAVTEVLLEKATGEDGSDLLRDKEWDRKASFPRLSEDQSGLIFEAKLKSPGLGVGSLKELSGTIRYSVAQGTKEIDLGFSEIKKGAKGGELGAEIVSIEDGWKKDGSEEVNVKLAVDKDSVKGLVLVEGSKRTELERRGYSSSGSVTTFGFESKSGFPENSQLLLISYDKMKTYDVPFSLKNVSLVGVESSE